MSGNINERVGQEGEELENSGAEAVTAHKSPSGGKPKKGSDDQFNRLGTEDISKLLREFGVPAITSLIIGGLYNILSAVFLGWGVGDIGLAVSTVANPTMIFFMSIAMLIGNGGNALAAIRLGEGKKAEAERVLGNTATLGIIGAIITVFIGFVLIDPVLAISGATPETWDLARTFIQILAAGSVLQILSMGLNNFMRTAGDPNRALWSMLVGTIVTIVLSFFFVIVFGWGIPGQAAAIVIGQGVSFVVVMHYFIFSKKSPFKLYAKNLAFAPKVPLTILSLGSASFLLNIAVAFVGFIINNQIAVYGAMSVIGENGVFAMFAVIQRIAMFVMFPVTGIAIAAQPLLGYCYGARLPERVKKTLSVEMRFGIICCAIMWALIEIFSPIICTWFGVSGGVLSYTQFALRIQTIVMPIMAVQIIISQYFQATGRPGRSVFLSLTRQIIYLIPLYLFLPIFVMNNIPQWEPIMGVILGPPVADVLSFITAMFFVVFEYRSLNRAIKLEAQGIDSGWGPNLVGDKNHKKMFGRKKEDAAEPDSASVEGEAAGEGAASASTSDGDDSAVSEKAEDGAAPSDNNDDKNAEVAVVPEGAENSEDETAEEEASRAQ